jgi:hypothetical protein
MGSISHHPSIHQAKNVSLFWPITCISSKRTTGRYCVGGNSQYDCTLMYKMMSNLPFWINANETKSKTLIWVYQFIHIVNKSIYTRPRYSYENEGSMLHSSWHGILTKFHNDFQSWANAPVSKAMGMVTTIYNNELNVVLSTVSHTPPLLAKFSGAHSPI